MGYRYPDVIYEVHGKLAIWGSSPTPAFHPTPPYLPFPPQILIFDHGYQSDISCPTAYDEQIDCPTTHAAGAESEEDRAAAGLDPSFG